MRSFELFNTKSQTKKDSFVLRFAPSYRAQKTALRPALGTGTRPFFQNLLQPTGSAAIQYWLFRLHTCIPIHICIHIYVYIEKALAHSRPRLFAHIIIFKTNAQTQPVPGKNVDWNLNTNSKLQSFRSFSSNKTFEKTPGTITVMDDH